MDGVFFMSDNESAATLLEIMINLEKKAQNFYQILIGMFSHEPKVTKFWKKLMDQERTQVQEIEKIRDSLTPDQLSSPTDPITIQDMRKSLEHPLDDIFDSINTLDDAYKTAHMFENSEAGNKFQSLCLSFITSKKRQKFFGTHIITHLETINNPPDFMKDLDWRKSVKAIKN